MSEENVNETANQQAENENVGGNEETTDTATEKAEGTKTFSQEDVNNIAAREARKAQEKLFDELGIKDFKNAKEGFQKFQEWQESQKTEQEKRQEQVEALNSTNETLTNENIALKGQLSALKQGAKGESVEDVLALAERRVNDDVTIDDAIKQVIEEYPQFAQQVEKEEKQKPNFTTGQHQSSGNANNPFAAHLARIRGEQ